jgi:GNAT superfamily N-acetyltransferase
LVEPRWSRRGHGSRLLAACVDHWRSDGFIRALAWAFAADSTYQAFLTSAGWQHDGAARALDMDGTLVDQVRLHTEL